MITLRAFLAAHRLNIHACRRHCAAGCFWERQWAYFNVETDPAGPFARAAADFTSYVGYAGGQNPPDDGSAVCYHTGDDRDYAHLGAAEAVQITLDDGKRSEQLAALAHDFFASFTGPSGSRARPDPMDRGPPYRSFVGLAGGMSSADFAIVEKENTFGMSLKHGLGGDADEFNTVFIYDTAAFPYYKGEVFHQNHCNFFTSEGMPYPNSYTVDLYDELKANGRYAPTGCPEQPWTHSPCATSPSGR